MLQGWQHVVKWHETTQLFTPHCQQWDGSVALRCDVRTDGSSRWGGARRTAGSGVVTTVHTTTGSKLVGILDDGITAPEAAAALLIACVRGLQLALRHPTHVCPFWIKFHFDCNSAGYTSAGHWQAKTHGYYQSMTRAIVYAIEELHGSNAVEWQHVYGHSGDPLNEAADAASWAAACGWTHSSSLRQWLSFLGDGDEATQEAVHWLWLLLANESRPLYGPRLDVRNQCWWFTVAKCGEDFTGQGHSFAKHSASRGPATSDIPKMVRIKMATANVLTLHPQRRGQYGNGVSARMESLLRQAAEANFMFVGIQESRCQGQGHKFTEEYHIAEAQEVFSCGSEGKPPQTMEC